MCQVRRIDAAVDGVQCPVCLTKLAGEAAAYVEPAKHPGATRVIEYSRLRKLTDPDAPRPIFENEEIAA